MKFRRLPIKLRQKRERERERKYRREQRREAGEEEFRKERSRINAFFFYRQISTKDYLINTVYYTLTESHQSSRAGTQTKDFGFLSFDFVLSFDPPVPSPVGQRCGGVSLILLFLNI